MDWALTCNSIKAKKAPGFNKPAIFRKVMEILEAHHFRLPACRFVLDLFDKRVLQQIIMEEEEEASQHEDEGAKEEEGEGGEEEGHGHDDDNDDDDSDSDVESEGEQGEARRFPNMS